MVGPRKIGRRLQAVSSLQGNHLPFCVATAEDRVSVKAEVHIYFYVARAEDRVSVKAEVHIYCQQPSRDRVSILGWSALQPPG